MKRYDPTTAFKAYSDYDVLHKENAEIAAVREAQHNAQLEAFSPSKYESKENPGFDRFADELTQTVLMMRQNKDRLKRIADRLLGVDKESKDNKKPEEPTSIYSHLVSLDGLQKEEIEQISSILIRLETLI